MSRSAILAATAVALLGSAAQAGIVYEQHFDLPEGSSTFGTIVAGSLSYGSMATTGNRLQQLNYANTGAKSIGAVLGDDENVWYTSVLFSRVSGNTGTRIQLHGWPWGGGDEYVFLGTRDNNSLFLNFAKTGSGEYYSADNAFDLSQTHLIVIKQDRSAGTSTTVSVFVDPTSTNEAANVPVIVATDTEGHMLRAFQMYNNAWNTTAQWDELRVGTTFADVAPIPEPAALGSIGIVTLLALRRRRA